MKLCKKIISLILAVLMATSALTVVDFSAYADYKNGETSADFDTGNLSNSGSTGYDQNIYVSSKISVGDYYTLGSYYGEPIVWRCVAIDENGPLMLSDKILCLKAFDAAGKSPYHEDDWGWPRIKGGSNCWSDSSIRQWLNTSGSVSYSHCPPSKQNVYNGSNPYDEEDGFLSGFSLNDLREIKEVTHRVYLNSYDQTRKGYCDGGSKELNYLINSSSSPIDYSKYYYQNVTDNLFLLGPEQIDEACNNLGKNYILYAYPTASAVKNSTFKNSSLDPSKTWETFFGVPRNEGASYENVTLSCTLDGTNSTRVIAAYNGEIGIRPAFYLNTEYSASYTNSVYIANCWLNNPELKKTIDMVKDSVDPTKAKVQYLKSGMYHALWVAWTAGKILDDPVSGAKYTVTKHQIYETIILGMLQNQAENKAVIDYLKEYGVTTDLKMYKKICSWLEKTAGIEASEIGNATNSWSRKSKRKVAELLKTQEAASTFGDALEFANDFLSKSKDINEFTNTVSKYIVVSQSSKDMADLLQMLGGMCTNNSSLSTAFNNISEICRDESAAFKRAAADSKDLIINWSVDYFVDQVVKKFSKTNAYLAGVKLGLGTGRNLSEIIWGTESEASQYYSMCALVDVEKAIEASVNYTGSGFLNYKSESNADLFISSVRLMFLCKELSCDYASDYSKIINTQGLQNEFFKGSKKRYENEKASFDNLKKIYADSYETLNYCWKVKYQIDYPNVSPYLALCSLDDTVSVDDSRILPWETYLEYSGKPVELNFDVICQDKTLVKDKDYTVKYENNDRPGIATVTVTGINNYSGTKKYDYYISSGDFAKRINVKADNFDNFELSVSNNNGVVAKISGEQILESDVPVITNNDSYIVMLYGNEDYTVNVTSLGSVDYIVGDINGDVEYVYNGVKLTDGDTITQNITVNKYENLLKNSDVIEHDYSSTENTEKHLVNSEYNISETKNASCGQKVYIIAPQKTGYKFVSWQSESVELNNSKSSQTEFVMPNCDVEINPIYEECEHQYKTEHIDANCDTAGYDKSVCEYCGDEKIIETSEPLGHKYVYESTVEATCLLNGYDLYKCEVCGDEVQKNSTPVAQHDYVLNSEFAPTCLVEGSKVYLCKNCKSSYVEYKDELGHDYVLTSHKDPTCNSKGYDEYTCSRCNGTKRDEIAALDGSALTSALDDAKKRMESGVFTDESVSACQKVCDKYQNAVNELHSQAEVDNVTAEVTSAYENLVLKDIVTGTLDNGMTWTFTKDGAKLSFAGEGEVPKFESGTAPWNPCGNIETLEFGEGITSIAGYAFTKYTTVKKINFPSTLTTINIRAFEYCYAVEELVIPDSVTFIGYGTFASLTSLKKVTVPASVGYASYAFEHDEQIEKIIITPGVDGIMPECTSTNNAGFPLGSNLKYTGAFGPWRNANNAVVDIRYGVKSIGKNTFYGAKILRLSVVASVKEIGYQALKTRSNTDVYVYNKDCVIDETNTNLSNVNIMIKDTNNEFVKKEHTHIWSWKYNNNAVYNSSTDYTDGTATRTCSACGQSETKTIEGTGLLRANTMNVLLDSNVSVNVGINNSRTAPFESVFFRFEVGGESYDVSDTSELSNSTRTCYAFDKVSPDKFADEITITPYGVTSDGIECKGHPVTYSIKNYCYNQLKKTPNYNLKALLVELLYYGKAHQDYRGYNVENPVTVDLTDEQKKLHTTDTLEYTKVTNSKYQLNPNGTDKNEVEYKSASMLLEGKVIPRIKVEISSSTSISDYTFRWTVDGQNTEFTYAEHPDWFTQTNGSASDKRAYYVDCTVLKADQFSTPFYLTVFKNGTQVSNMLQYSVESYATGSTVKNSPKLKVLIDQMLRYGRAVQKYLNV